MIKRIAAVFMALLIIFQSTDVTVFAADELKVNEVGIIYKYGDVNNLESKQLRIEGSFLTDAVVTVDMGDINNLKTYTNKPSNIGDTGSDNVFYIEIEGSDKIEGIWIKKGDKTYTIKDLENEKLPSISKLENTNVYIKTGILGMLGTYLDNITGLGGTTEYSMEISSKEGVVTGTVTNNGSDALTITNMDGKPGRKNINIKRVYQKDVETIVGAVAGIESVKMSLENKYENAIKLVNEITISDIQMTPNVGEPGDEIRFTSSENLSGYDIFLVKNKNDILTAQNKCTDWNYKTGSEGEKNTLRVRVPNIKEGLNQDYFVVITNKIPDGTTDIESLVTKQTVLDEKFKIIDGAQKLKIKNVSPLKGPDNGVEMTIQGEYIGKLEPYIGDLEKVNSNDNVIDETKITKEGSGENKGQLKIEYKLSEESAKTVESITRWVDVKIGNTSATFIDDYSNKDRYSFAAKGMDKISVMTPILSKYDDDPKKEIRVMTTTKIEYKDGSIAIYTGEDEYDKQFEYETSIIKPVVTGIVPDELFLTEVSSAYELDKDVLVSINGSNFLIQKYLKKEDNGENTTITAYPVIRIGEVEYNKNSNPDIEMYVLDKNDNILDGSEGNQLGTRILIMLPKGKIGFKNLLDNDTRDVTVTNTIKNTSEEGLSSTLTDGLKIKLVEDENPGDPKIDSVTPNIVTTEGGQDITIIGSNFRGDVKVIIDGKQVKTITRQADGKQITFKAPPGRECTTQLQVINPDNGMDVAVFRYVKAYTDPKISEISPDTGTKDTLAIISGQNFLKPDPSSGNTDIMKLIGTRVLFEGKDINEYNKDSNGSIILKGYSAPEQSKLLSIDSNGVLKAAGYCGAIILEEKTSGKIFTVEQGKNGNISILSGIESFKLSVAEKDDKNIIKAVKEDNGVYELKLTSTTVGNDKFDSLSIYPEGKDKAEYEFILYTPYMVEGGIITGNRARVMGIDEIYVTIPELGEKEVYDVTVVNPDTNSDTLKDAFTYRSNPQTKPSIVSIVPNKGHVDGGYTVIITGQKTGDAECFVSYENGSKTRVLINGKDATNVVVLNPEKLVCIVPKLDIDPSEKYGTKSLSVPITILNPDGGTFSSEDGFTYVIPDSKPKISNILPNKGSAAGGEVVEIFGEDFRKEGTEYPNVFFGDSAAAVEEMNSGYIKVKTPKSTAGKASVDVYVLNPDFGMSNKMKYSYESSNPKIKSITPSVGNKAGNEDIEITGTEFDAGEVSIYGKGSVTMPLVRFGSITNKGIPREQENSGRIDSNNATVKLDGGLVVSYNGETRIANFEVSVDQQKYSAQVPYSSESGDPLYVPMSILKSEANGDPLQIHELVEISVSNGRIFVERGYSESGTLTGRESIKVKTASSYTTGKVDLYVINPDGGIAKGVFEYKNPDSKPEITKIFKDSREPEKAPYEIEGEQQLINVIKVSYKGGNTIRVVGKDFRENAVIKIGDLADVAPANIDYTLPSEMKFTMPQVDEDAVGKIYDMVIVNEDGGVASSSKIQPEPVYIMIIKGDSAPTIEKIVPSQGASSGGEEAIIYGKDFRAGLSVFFGENKVDAGSVTLVDYKTIKVKTPSSSPGKVDVKVENSDGEIGILAGGYTYISRPVVSKIVSVQSDSKTISSISIDGGEKIKIKGSGFVEGAKVLFAPEIEEAKTENADFYIGSKPYRFTESTDSAGVEFVSSEILIVTTPEGKLDEKGLIIVNPDKGASDVYNGIKYGLEEIEAPEGAKADLIYDRYIRVTWSEVEGASEYEIYVSEDDGSYEHVVNTVNTSFVYQDVESNTEYRFKIRAVGKISTSNPSKETNKVTTKSSAGYEDKDGELSESTSVNLMGDDAWVIIGTDDYRDETVIDLTTTQLSGARSVTVNIPMKAANSSSAGEIKIKGLDFALQFNPSIFSQSAASNDSDSGIRVRISPSDEAVQLGQTTLSSEYKIDASVFQGSEERVLYAAGGPMLLTLDFDMAKAAMRRLDNVYLSSYDSYSGSWTMAAQSSSKYSSSVSAMVYRPGRYRVMGSR